MFNDQIVCKKNVDVIDWPKFFAKYNRGVVVLDFETTGLSVKNSRVMEVGAAKVVDGKIVDQFSELGNPGGVVPEEITKITGINTAMLADKRPVGEIIAELQKFIGKHPIVAHNAPFEAKFLAMEMKLANLQFSNAFICTRILATHLLAGLQSYKLAMLKEHIKFVPPVGHQAHRALSDVQTTVALWQYMHAKVAQQPQQQYAPGMVNYFDATKTKSKVLVAASKPLSRMTPQVMLRSRFK